MWIERAEHTTRNEDSEVVWASEKEKRLWGIRESYQGGSVRLPSTVQCVEEDLAALGIEEAEAMNRDSWSIINCLTSYVIMGNSCDKQNEDDRGKEGATFKRDGVELNIVTRFEEQVVC